MCWIRPRRPAGGVAEGGFSNRRLLGLVAVLVLRLVLGLGLRLGLVAMLEPRLVLGLRLGLVPLMPGF